MKRVISLWPVLARHFLIIAGNQYWRYTENNVDRGYPRPLSVWSGLPPRIDAAIKWRNGRTYFFSGSQYYRYNDVEFNVSSVSDVKFKLSCNLM